VAYLTVEGQETDRTRLDLGTTLETEEGTSLETDKVDNLAETDHGTDQAIMLPMVQETG
jgi:hypothetical protein